MIPPQASMVCITGVALIRVCLVYILRTCYVCNKVSATLYRALDLVHKALKIGPSPTLCGPSM
jgi:Flp pilus assembly protein TadB